MFTCEEYKTLEELLQAQLLKIDGIHLMGRKTERLNVKLFILYNFYVEIFFFKENDQSLYIKSFENVDYLNLYFNQIKIDNVFEGVKDR